MQRTDLTRLGTALAATIMIAAAPAHSANLSKAVYDGAREQLKTTYQANRDACDKLSANAKDVCVEKAKGMDKVARAQLDYNHSGTSKDALKLHEARYEAAYAIGHEMCDDLTGNAKDVCQQAAKTERDKAKADTKMAEKMAAASEDTIEAHLKAEYKLAQQKCEALSGDAKDICVASAKARYQVGR